MSPAELEVQTARVYTASKVVNEALDLAAMLWPTLAPVFMIMKPIVSAEVRKVISGLEAGTLVPDQRGGIVPVTNSHYNLETGRFLGKG